MIRPRVALPAVLALVALAVAVIVLRAGGGAYTVRAAFADADGLRPNFFVKIGGVPVGKVVAVGLGPHDTAIATLHIDSGAGRVGPDARATIRPSNLLGEKYVELDPGSAVDAVPSGTIIPLARTATPTELDDLFDTFDPQTRLALGVFLSEQGKALVGRGADLGAMLARMPRALDSARQMIGDLGADNRALGRLVERSDRILVAVARERAGLGRLVDSGAGAFDALASRQAALAATIRGAPGAVAQLHTSLAALRRAAAPLIPAAVGLRATAAPLERSLRALPRFAAAARPTLRTLSGTSPALARLGGRGAPFVRRLERPAAQLDRFAGALEPVTRTLDTGIGDALGLMEGWARAISNRDAAGHVYRVGLLLGTDVTRALMHDYIKAGRRAHRDRRPARPALPSLGGGAAPRPTAPVPLPQVTPPKSIHVPGLPPIALPTGGGQAQSGDGSVGRLLDYLLG